MRGKALSFLVSFALVSGLALPLGAAEVWRGPSSLEVRVEDSAGKAVEGAKVRLLYQAVEPKTGPAIATTDRDGEASFFSLAEGWWALEVSKEGALSIHSEFVLSGEKKPAVLSTFQENTAGATQTLQVRIGRPRAGRAAGDPTGGPRVGRPAAPAAAPTTPPAAPAPAPATPPAEQPAAPAPVPTPNAPGAPPSAPSPVPAPPQAPAERPAPAPSVAPALPSTPPAQPTPPPAAAPSPSPAPVPAPPMVVPQEKPETPPTPSAPVPSAPAPNPAPVVASPPVPTPTPTPTPASPPAPAAPVVAPAPVAPPPPAPALPEPKAQRRSYAERSCIECKAGEEALSVEVAVPPGTAPCGERLENRLSERDAAKAEAGLPPSCRLLRIILPPGARFTGYRYEVEDGGASRDCRAGADCPVGASRFPLDPGIRRGPTGTAFTAAFENTSPDRSRRAIFTVYFAPE